jgi:hypothetical protein
MAVDELAQIKTALAELNEREAPTRRGTLRADHRPSPAQSELAELQSLLSADSNLREFGESLTRRRNERHKALQAQMRSDAQTSQAVGAASSAAAIAARRHALALLAQPFTSSYVTLDEPFLIWELPHPELDIFRDSNIETFGSWVKILVDTKSTPGGWHATDFRFYFLWENPSDYYAVANVSSSLALNGQAVAWGGSGVLSGDHAYLNVNAYLSIVRWSGWGDDPDTGQSNDQTPYPIYNYQSDYQSSRKSVVSFDAYGGGWFSDAEPKSKTFDPQMPYGVSARLIAIPGRAVTLFEVGLEVEWWFNDGYGQTVDDDDQSITLDLAYDPLAYMARCPMVELEILTPPAALSGGQARA